MPSQVVRFSQLVGERGSSKSSEKLARIRINAIHGQLVLERLFFSPLLKEKVVIVHPLTGHFYSPECVL